MRSEEILIFFLVVVLLVIISEESISALKCVLLLFLKVGSYDIFFVPSGTTCCTGGYGWPIYGSEFHCFVSVFTALENSPK
jgi:hypothetical protein